MIAVVALGVLGLALAALPLRRVVIGFAVATVVWALSYTVLPPNVWEPLVLISVPPVVTGWALGLLVRGTLRKVRSA